MEAPRERLIRYLQDAHSAEVGIAKMLEGFIDEAADEDMVRVLFQDHMSVTRSQAARLEERLNQLDSHTSDSRNFFSGLMAKVGEMMSSSGDAYDKATQNLIKAYATEHFEQGMYCSLIAYAEACGDEETALLAEEILAEEEEAALKLFPMIEVSAQRTYDAAASTESG